MIAGDFDIVRADVSAIENCHVAQKFIDEGVGGSVVHVSRSAGLFDLAVVHDGDRGLNYFERFLLIVCDEDAGDMQFVMQTSEPASKFFPYAGIQRAERFIEQEDFRLYGECSR